MFLYNIGIHQSAGHRRLQTVQGLSCRQFKKRPDYWNPNLFIYVMYFLLAALLTYDTVQASAPV